MKVSRRSFIGCGAAALIAGCVSEPPPKQARIGLQLYSVRGYLKKHGLAKTLRDVRAIGYAGVQFAPGRAFDFHGFPADELRAMLSDSGLEPCGTHLSRLDLAPGKIERAIGYNLAIGNRFLCCPGGGMLPGECWKGTREQWWERVAESFVAAAETASAVGCRIGIHNHGWEFSERTHGTSVWDYLFANAPANVCMELDVGHAVAAGENPGKWLARYPRRSFTFHAQENGAREKGTTFRGVLGEPGLDPDGKPAKGVDWDSLFAATERDGVEWCVVECEMDADSLAAAKASFAFLKGMGKC